MAPEKAATILVEAMEGPAAVSTAIEDAMNFSGGGFVFSL